MGEPQSPRLVGRFRPFLASKSSAFRRFSKSSWCLAVELGARGPSRPRTRLPDTENQNEKPYLRGHGHPVEQGGRACLQWFGNMVEYGGILEEAE